MAQQKVSTLMVLKNQLIEVLKGFNKANSDFHLELGKITCFEEISSMQMHIYHKNSQGEYKTAEGILFESYSDEYGLDKSDLGKSFNYNGSEYTLVGFDPRQLVKAKPQPITTICSNRKTIFTIELFKSAIKEHKRKQNRNAQLRNKRNPAAKASSHELQA